MPLFWIAFVYLLVVLIFALFVKTLDDLPEDLIQAQAIDGLVMADEVLYNTMSQVAWRKEEDISRIVPPIDRTDLSDWAADIQAHMDVECAVFLYDGNLLRWPLLPARFESSTGKVDSAVRLPFKTDSVSNVRTLGNVELQVIWSLTDGPRALILDPPDSELRWGVVYHFEESYWPSFLRLLGRSTNLTNDWDLAPLRATFDIIRRPDRPDSLANKSKYGLQIFSQSDSLYFTTPQIDTSYRKFEQRHDSISFYTVVYNTASSESYLRLVKEMYKSNLSLPWFKIGFLVFEMLVLLLFYFWIGRLTRP